MAKVRVYELAKEFGVESKVVLAKLGDLGEFVRSASSTVEAPVVRKLREAFADAPVAPPAKKAAPAKAAAKTAAKKVPAGTASSPAPTPMLEPEPQPVAPRAGNADIGAESYADSRPTGRCRGVCRPEAGTGRPTANGASARRPPSGQQPIRDRKHRNGPSPDRSPAGQQPVLRGWDDRYAAAAGAPRRPARCRRTAPLSRRCAAPPCRRWWTGRSASVARNDADPPRLPPRGCSWRAEPARPARRYRNR